MNIYCINLDERTDRWNFIQKQFSNMQEIILVRVPAIKHRYGWVGCGLSHIKIVEEHMKDDEYLIIIEDDCVINDTTNFYNKLIDIFQWLDKNGSQWDIFNGNPSFVINTKNCQILDPDLKIIKYGAGGTANFIIYNTKNSGLRNKLLEYKKNIMACIKILDNGVDKTKSKTKKNILIKDINGKICIYNLNKNRNKIIYDKFLNTNFICVTTIPFLTCQLVSLSDIENKCANYNKALKISEETLSNL